MLKVVTITPGCSTDGRQITMKFVDADGASETIVADTSEATNLYFAVEEAVQLAHEQQRKKLRGADPRAFGPIHAKTLTAFGGAVSVDGRPILDIEINGKIRLSLALQVKDLRTLIEWLERFEEELQAPPTKPN